MPEFKLLIVTSAVVSLNSKLFYIIYDEKALNFYLTRDLLILETPIKTLDLVNVSVITEKCVSYFGGHTKQEESGPDVTRLS